MVEIAPVRGRAAWTTGAGRLAVVLLVAQACWRGAYLLRGYYVQDDFRMLQLGSSNGLTLDYLFQEYSGHMWPGDFLLAWATARIDPMSWTLTAVFLLVLQLAAGAVMWLVLSRLMGDSWLRIPVLAVFLFSPLTLWSLQWWAQAIGYLPVTLLLLCAVWALLRRIQDDWRWGSPLAVGLVLLALAFQERALLAPLVLGGVALIIGEGPPLPRLRATLLSYWRLWAALAVVAGRLCAAALPGSAGAVGRWRVRYSGGRAHPRFRVPHAGSGVGGRAVAW